MDEEKKVEKVVKGSVKLANRSIGSKIDEKFELEDNKEVFNYVISGLLIPKLKDLFYELVTGSIEKKMYGTSGSTRRSGGRRPNERYSYHTDYTRPSNRSNTGSSDSDSSEKLDYKDIILYERADAEEVLSTLTDLIDQYGQACIGDLYDAAGITDNEGNFQMEKYGWTNLSSAKVRRVHDGYILDMPRARYLD